MGGGGGGEGEGRRGRTRGRALKQLTAFHKSKQLFSVNALDLKEMSVCRAGARKPVNATSAPSAHVLIAS